MANAFRFMQVAVLFGRIFKMSKQAEKAAKMIGIGAAVGVVGAAAAAAMAGTKHHHKSAPRKKLMKDAKQVGSGITTMWNDVVSMMH